MGLSGRIGFEMREAVMHYSRLGDAAVSCLLCIHCHESGGVFVAVRFWAKQPHLKLPC
jgi:hypothetical protein